MYVCMYVCECGLFVDRRGRNIIVDADCARPRGERNERYESIHHLTMVINAARLW